jgi:dethiobiotin synthetase
VSGPRPAVVVLVAGTGTDVGKTWVSVRLLEAWRGQGLAVAARKPAQSFAAGPDPTDADLLAAATGEDPTGVCPAHRWYPVPMAPPMAAQALGRPGPTMADLVGELDWPTADVDVAVVETAGGVRSPQADDGDVTDMVSALAPDHVVLVADAGLGTINAVRLSLAALATGASSSHGGGRQDDVPPIPLVILNRFDPASELHRRNRDWLRHRDGTDVTEATGPWLESVTGRLWLSPRPVAP